MELAAQDAELKAALFRFVDVVPACRSLDDLARHLTGFLGEVEAPPPPVAVAMRMGNTRAGRTALGAAAAAGVKHMAHRFIVGESPKAALGTLRDLWKDGVASSVDLLGEATVTQAEAQRYAERCDEALQTIAAATAKWPERPALERDSAGPLPRANLSVKVSALTPLLRPDAPERGKRDAADRLRGLLRRAREVGAHLHIDMESLDSRDAVLELVLELLAEPEFRDGPVGGHGAPGLPARLARRRSTPCSTGRAGAGAGRAHPLTVRLVKGAYWDHEIVEAAQHGWSAPVFEVKADSDRNFEALTRRMIDARGRLRVAIASHNLRSIAHAIAYNAARRRRARGPRAAGPARPRRPAPARDRRPGPARAHVLPGRRPRRRHGVPRAPAAGEHVQRLVPGRPGQGRPARGAARRAMTPLPPFANEPVLELRRAPVRARLADALAAFDARGPVDAPGLDRQRARAPATRSSPPTRASPTASSRARRRRRRPRSTPRSAAAPAPWRAAGRRARRGARARRRAPARAPARDRRARRCASAPSRGPRPTRDVCEAIDFLEYYARGAIEIEAGAPLLQVPGERNTLQYVPRGVVAVISPWNFPVAIPCGMVAAGLATGNAVRAQAGRAGAGLRGELVRALREAGVPPEALALLPGEGDVGAALVRDPRVHTIAFTGSSAVGLEIVRTAAEVAPGQRHLKRVIAEMGGKNCVIVDGDADLDEVVPALVRSRRSSTRARSAPPPRACSCTRRSTTGWWSGSRARSRCSRSATPSGSTSTCRP